MANAKDLVALHGLYRDGVLTQDEYVAARRKLLGYRVGRLRPLDRELPVLFALAALAVVAAACAVYFLLAH